MAENRSARSITVSPYEPRGLLQEGRLEVARPDGSEYRRIASAAGGLATKLGGIADVFAKVEGDRAGTIAGGAENFRPTGKLTIRGRAFDQAGQESYLNQLDASMREDMQTLYEQKKDDPEGLRTSLDQMRELYHQKHIFPEIGPQFDAAFSRLSSAYRNRATENFDTTQRQQLQGELVSTLSNLQTTQSQQLASLDPTDPAAVDTLVSTQHAVDVQIDRAVEQKLMTPAEGEKTKIEGRRESAKSFYLRQAETLKNPEEIASFGEAVRKGFSEGKLPGLDAEGYDDLIAGVGRLETRATTEGKTADNALDKRLDSYVERVASGLDVPADEWKSILLDAGGAPNGAALTDLARQKLTYAKIIRDRPIADAETAIANLRTRIQPNATPQGKALLDFADGQLRQEKTRLQTDMLGAAARRGIIGSVTPLTLTPDPLSGSIDMNTLAGEVAGRVAQADAAADALGVPARYLRPGEAELIRNLAAQNPDVAASIAGGLVSGAGAHAVDVVRELGTAAPEVAQAGAILADGGSAAAARDVLRGAAKNPTTGERPPDIDQTNRFAENRALGIAFTAQPEDGMRVEETARNIARARAADLGLDPKSNEALPIYRQALIDATGAVAHDGVQYGGLAGYDLGFWSLERKTIAPQGVRADRFRDTILAIQDADLPALDVPPENEDGSPVPARMLQAAIPVKVKGGYAFSMGDPESDPRWIRGRDGKPFVLDFEMLRPTLEDRVPDAFLSGGAVTPRAAPMMAEPKPAGLIAPGNIDLSTRPQVKNADGSISTVRSMSFEEDGVEVLIPTVSDDGRILSDDAAIADYRRTGRFLGKFSSAAAADRYAKRLHEDQARRIAQ